ncbi:hypothetical protein [Herbaspirillum sp. B65]|uniref:hypothetical protein n=1 Tax=Herbaspirillum sp. B65 TaxID=137708 RepID=UPI000A045991|nr:hypothetical protein [Herbaspirillum sp. B65]
MNDLFRIEQGSEAVVGHCDTCGHETKTFRGFGYDGDGAFAVYACTFTGSLPENCGAMAISIRGWGDGADTIAKECVALSGRVINGGPGCRVLDAPGSRWAHEGILGRMLLREDALSSGRAKEAFSVSDFVWMNDPRLSLALNNV